MIDRHNELLKVSRGLLRSLEEMVECYGSDDGHGPIPIIERAKAEIKAALKANIRNAA